MKQWGKTRIIGELKARGISRYNIDTALKEITAEEYNTTFHNLADKQWEAIRESNPAKKKNKFLGYMLRKGFETNLIYDKIADFNAT